MSRMVSRYTSDIQSREIQGHMLSDGKIHYTFVQMGRNRGQLTTDEKDKMLASGLYKMVFNEEEEAKEEFELLGFLL